MQALFIFYFDRQKNNRLAAFLKAELKLLNCCYTGNDIVSKTRLLDISPYRTLKA